MPMQVILTEDIPKLGNAGDVVKVKPGYGRNYLIPKGLAQLATESRIRVLDHKRRVIGEKIKREMKSHQAVAVLLAKAQLSFERQTNVEGKLFGSVTNADIQAQLKEQGFEVERRKIELSEPIKQVGEHSCHIRLFRDVEMDLDVQVTSSEVIAAPIEEISSADAQMDAAEEIEAAEGRERY